MIKINTTKLPLETLPMLMYSGEVITSTAGSNLTQITLMSHEDVGNIVEKKKLLEILNNQIMCRRYVLENPIYKYELCEKFNIP